MDHDLSKAFIYNYYSIFDENRAGLSKFYLENSILTYEGLQFHGVESINTKLTSLPYQQCQHKITTIVCQDTGRFGGMLVRVFGSLHLDGDEHALGFGQTFHLIPTPEGSFNVTNDIFWLMDKVPVFMEFGLIGDTMKPSS